MSGTNDSLRKWLEEEKARSEKSIGSSTASFEAINTDQLFPMIESSSEEPDDNFTTLGELAERYGSLEVYGFKARMPYHFLIQESLLTRASDDGHYFTTSDKGFPVDRVPIFSRSAVYILRKKSELFRQMFTVGRAGNSDISIDFSTVSKFHAYFVQRGQEWYIADSGSTNGTFINGQRLPAKTPTPITADTEIGFSQGAVFRFVDASRLHDYISVIKNLGR